MDGHDHLRVGIPRIGKVIESLQCPCKCTLYAAECIVFCRIRRIKAYRYETDVGLLLEVPGHLSGHERPVCLHVHRDPFFCKHVHDLPELRVEHWSPAGQFRTGEAESPGLGHGRPECFGIDGLAGQGFVSGKLGGDPAVPAAEVAAGRKVQVERIQPGDAIRQGRLRPGAPSVAGGVQHQAGRTGRAGRGLTRSARGARLARSRRDGPGVVRIQDEDRCGRRRNVPRIPGIAVVR